MKIPIENIYYLLCYAWDKFNEGEKVKVDIEPNSSLLDLLSRILINATRILLKRGIDHDYINTENEVSGIKGKLLISQSIKQNSFKHSKSICSFDEFSSDTLLNQILYTSLKNVINTDNLSKENRKDAIAIIRMFPPTTEITLSETCFRNIRVNRNNSFYDFVLKISRLIYESLLPRDESGNYSFYDFTRDEKKMAALFEQFVRNFYKKHQEEYRVKSETIAWKFTATDEDKKYIPEMHTDITLYNQEQKIIIDTKYYVNTMSSYHDSEKIHSHNLYQLFSYLVNQNKGDSITRNATGVLLYPTSYKEYDDLNYQHEHHKILIRTVNLNTHWKDIAKRLLDLISSFASLSEAS